MKTKISKRYVKLWLKFKAEFQETPNGVVIHKNRCSDSPTSIKKAMQQFYPYLGKLIKAGKIWQARMYDSLDNKLLFKWPNEDDP